MVEVYGNVKVYKGQTKIKITFLQLRNQDLQQYLHHLMTKEVDKFM